jgi:hypothetical protein
VSTGAFFARARGEFRASRLYSRGTAESTDSSKLNSARSPADYVHWHHGCGGYRKGFPKLMKMTRAIKILLEPT